VFISTAYAQTAATSGSSDFSSLIIFVPMILVMYFVMFRPQMKRQKEQKMMLEALAKNDEVITNGGILGKVTKVSDAFISIEVSTGVEIQVQKGAVTTLLPKGTIKGI
jgi:preprotein translocase subunit YajC